VRASLQPDGGRRYVDKIVTLGATGFVLIAAAATLAAPLFVALYARPAVGGERGFTADGLALATAFAYWCLPQVLFYALYSLLGEVLNARRAFGAYSWAPVVNNVVAIAGLAVFVLLFGSSDANSSTEVWDTGRIALLAGTATAGVAAQAFVLTLFWRRAGLSYRPDFRWRGVGLGRAGRAAGWTFGMILVTQLAGIVQSQVASIAATDGVSVLALQNSWLIFMLPHSVIAVSIGTAYFTRMSTHASVADTAALRTDVSGSLRSIGLLITFSSVALAVVALPFARVFEKGGFDAVTQMAVVIVAFVAALVPFSAVFVLQRAFYALEDTRTPFFVETAKAGAFVTGALLASLAPSDRVGLGIALATSAACVLQTVLTFALLRRRLGPLGGRLLLRRHVQYLVAAAAAAAVGVLLLLLLGGADADGFGQSDVAPAVVVVAAVGAAMLPVYLGVLTLMRVPEVRDATAAVRARLPGIRRP